MDPPSPCQTSAVVGQTRTVVDRLVAAVLAMSLALGLAATQPIRAAATTPDSGPDAPLTWWQPTLAGLRLGVQQPPLAAEPGAPGALADPVGPEGPADNLLTTPPTTIKLRPRPKPGPFSMNLYSAGDFVHQKTVYWCVAASVQTMVNIIEDDKPDRTKRSQRRLHLDGRSLDPGHAEYWRQLPDGSSMKRGLHGLGLVDWTEMLNASGHGPYVIDRAESRKGAIRMAARAMRTTGKPVGLVVWKGAHAWVMSGFVATADPAYSDDFKVTKVFIEDPWYPDVSAIWGASRTPNSGVAVAALDADYLPYDRPGRVHPKRDGRFMLILPTLPEGTLVN